MTMDYDEIRAAITDITAASLDKYHGYAWAVGYFGSMLTEAIYLMDGEARAEFERRLVNVQNQMRESND